MIANPVILGKLMREIVQKHLLNKKHFNYKEYVEEVIKKLMAIAVAKQIENAKKQAAILQLSAQSGRGTTVSPAAQDLCRIADDARYSDLVQKHSENARLLFRSDEPHERALGDGIMEALSTFNMCLYDNGTGAPGFQVKDFNKNGAITRALKAFLNPNINLPQPQHHQQAGQLQTNAHPNAQNPYTFESQEFLRHRLFADFESTLARGKAAASETGPIAKLKALREHEKTDKSTRAMLVSLSKLNDAAVGSTLYQIHPDDYDRHVEMAGLHEKALAILSSTHSANGTLDTDEKAAIDRAKVKVAYYLLKALATDVHTEIPNPRRKDRKKADIAGDRDKAIGLARQLRSDYDTELAKGNAAFVAWAAKLTEPAVPTTPPPPPKKKKKP